MHLSEIYCRKLMLNEEVILYSTCSTELKGDLQEFCDILHKKTAGKSGKYFFKEYITIMFSLRE